MKVKRTGITEILISIWLFSANKTKSSEYFSKQPTQLIVHLNSSLQHIIVTQDLNFKLGIGGNCLHLKAENPLPLHSQIFRYCKSIFCLPHQPISDFFDLRPYWVSVVREQMAFSCYTFETERIQ